MPLLTPDVGEVEALKRIVNYSSSGDLILHLFTSNTTPAEGDTVSTYSEMSGMGYASKTLTGSSWTIQTDGGTSTASYPQQSFDLTSGAGASVYGYFVTNAAGTILMWAERFSDGPYTIPTGGGSVKITLSFSLA